MRILRSVFAYVASLLAAFAVVAGSELAAADSPAGSGYVNNSWGSSDYTWVADFNGDGRDDIASADGSTVHMYLSSGRDFELGKWAVSGEWGSAGYTWVDDFNGDGKADIATAMGSTIKLYTSTGRGFTYTETKLNNNWGDTSYSFSGDFNGDGKADIATAIGGVIHLKLSTGTGFTAAKWTVPSYSSSFWGAGSYTWIGYFNEDEYQDIATANGGNIRVLLSDGSKFSYKNTVVPSTWGSAAFTWSGDFNNDGVTDIASGNGGAVYANLNTAQGGFNQEKWTVPGSWGSAVYTFAADLNGDGALGIVSFNSGQAYVHLSTGSSLDSSTWSTQGTWGAGGYTWKGDFDGDGYEDVASANGNSIYMHLSTGNRFVNQTWFSSKGLDQPLTQVSSNDTVFTATTQTDGTAVTRVSPASFCQLKYPDDWVKKYDERRNLPLNVSDANLDVTYFTPWMSLADMDGLYIFVYKQNGDFVVRRSDRADDVGLGVKGEQQYIYDGNPAYTPTWWYYFWRGEKIESPHQFVRHSQINHGYSPV